MNVGRSHVRGVLCLRLEDGDTLDCGHAAEVKAQALRWMDGAGDVVVDLSEVQFVDSVGVGVLVSLFKAARLRGRRAAFAGATPGVRRVLEIIKLDRIFELHPDAHVAALALEESRGTRSVAG